MCDSCHSGKDKRLSVLVDCLLACFDAIEFLEFQNAHLGQLCSELGPAYEIQGEAIDCIEVKFNPISFFGRQQTPIYCTAHSEITISETHVNVANNVRAVICFSDNLSMVDQLIDTILQVGLKAKIKAMEYYNLLF